MSRAPRERKRKVGIFWRVLKENEEKRSRQNESRTLSCGPRIPSRQRSLSSLIEFILIRFPCSLYDIKSTIYDWSFMGWKIDCSKVYPPASPTDESRLFHVTTETADGENPHKLCLQRYSKRSSCLLRS